MMNDQVYMQRCLELAVLGAGKTSPNPMVGAVIVYEDQIIGEGYTSPYGGPHAEVNAINNAIAKFGEIEALERFKCSTIYVSLEPCAHFGKTPPCADLIVEMGIQKVVIACLDPYAKVNGLGLKKLQDAGIATEVGVLEAEAKWVNRRFFTKIAQSRPYIILKWAETADGFFAPIDSSQKWISNVASKQLVHKWRAEEDAILVGKNTAIVDNPSLTVRDWQGRNPKRVLIDKNLAVPPDFSILNDQAETIVFNAIKTDWQGHLKYVELENFDLYLPQQILCQLYLMDIQSVIIEGGKKTLDMFIEAGLWDEARVFQSTESWETGVKAPKFNGQEIAVEKIGSDVLSTFVPHK
ncbi:bifunctional diaminohydroxyphosphoribosylaminopyrimidine deaminase/5-amino-6-(5-phosphoribosylamino)uracil reductase RibD [Sphingobacterium sp. DK4209]|uniref:Riboflavin biosynthesis protein RibD n=1 Tax=Sphingobacterium zhuxiongii TaxID=2662364 RepID=A0A5Q0QAM7_9SPHI|nr:MULTISPECIES: bifunctional diaminohydroxyphosphoribosylaminopyrimidine deaminase/5-amino-6-(5-phosphoribosylamino)uracil reductase RibD [unclassified Sphingobacterium]MVZ67094.1 bifunctional diaminohydroxyphosphoribosylaminopyrimidine deaminase/5-amino-6-(5-phosphoribosylamino)uracil reductase RibD [Sphingobacterium sp. DK4209]QGA25961.1 bifunctional diaminohydroxyphosphoribosylaminopyrimidine deaminase/5-amino-6-(5-phosphoribosylamino)uracil reductase RibD [Sphingobacterium sp. dk4302]